MFFIYLKERYLPSTDSLPKCWRQESHPGTLMWSVGFPPSFFTATANNCPVCMVFTREMWEPHTDSWLRTTAVLSPEHNTSVNSPGRWWVCTRHQNPDPRWTRNRDNAITDGQVGYRQTHQEQLRDMISGLIGIGACPKWPVRRWYLRGSGLEFQCCLYQEAFLAFTRPQICQNNLQPPTSPLHYALMFIDVL